MVAFLAGSLGGGGGGPGGWCACAVGLVTSVQMKANGPCPTFLERGGAQGSGVFGRGGGGGGVPCALPLEALRLVDEALCLADERP